MQRFRFPRERNGATLKPWAPPSSSALDTAVVVIDRMTDQREVKLLTMMAKICSAGVAFLAFAPLPLSAAQEQPAALDGPKVILQDPLLDKMVGKWKVGGTIRGRTVEQSVEAQWVLNHQFLQVHEKGVPDSKSAGPGYEAMVMIGYDHASERYVAHWTDIYGGRFSETLGYGVRSGDQIEFVFEYPDGPFHTTFRWLPEKQQWQWLMKMKDGRGQWVEFANLVLTREPEH